MNQKWASFKDELSKEIEKDRICSYENRLQLFYNSIEQYIGQEIKYGSTAYKKISKVLTELCFRTYSDETVYHVIKRNNIPYKYENDNLIIIKKN